MKRIVLELSEYESNHLLNQVEQSPEGNIILKGLRTGNNTGIDAQVIKEGFVIENLEEKLKKLRDGIKALQESGISMKLLESYVRTRGVSQRNFRDVLDGINDFFRQLN